MILLSLIIIVLILIIATNNSNIVNGCYINYDTKYIKPEKPTSGKLVSEPDIIKKPAFERFYDENMLIHLDGVLFDESKYRTVMKHTDDGALL